MNAIASVLAVSVVCDQVDQVVPAHQVDDIDEVHELDPVHQVNHKDEQGQDMPGRSNGSWYTAVEATGSVPGFCRRANDGKIVFVARNGPGTVPKGC